jgi:hypothetical protein
MWLRKSKYYLSIVTGLLMSVICYSQDSVRVLSKDAFIKIVKTYHPVIQQAEISIKRAESVMQQSRGAFDPVISTTIDKKTFDGKEYYNYFNPRISIPTWYGIDIKAGTEEITGKYVNPQATLGQNSYLGLKVSTNELLFDKRRATLRQSRLLEKMSAVDRDLTVNNVLYEAISCYWNWVKEYQNYIIIKNTVKVNEKRLQFIRTEYEQGIRQAIDTTETLAQLQGFYTLEQAAFAAYLNAGLELSNYLWKEDNQPVYWEESILPDTANMQHMVLHMQIPPLTEFTADIYKHPKLSIIEYKLEELSIEKRLKAQYLIPKVSVDATLLKKKYALPDELSATYLNSNNKFTIDISVPIFMREARGSYKATKLKIVEKTLEQSHQALQIENKVKAYYNEVVALHKQVDYYHQAFINYQKLYQGEQLKMDVGESSLFLLNSRENKLLETHQKLIELTTKWHKTYAGLIWATGKLQ